MACLWECHPCRRSYATSARRVQECSESPAGCSKRSGSIRVLIQYFSQVFVEGYTMSLKTKIVLGSVTFIVFSIASSALHADSAPDELRHSTAVHYADLN